MFKQAMDDNFWVFTLVAFFGAFLLVVYLSSCDGGFSLSNLDKAKMSEESADNTPNEIVPGDGGRFILPNLLDETIVRSKGKPQTVSFNFAVNNPETCNPNTDPY